MARTPLITLPPKTLPIIVDWDGGPSAFIRDDLGVEEDGSEATAGQAQGDPRDTRFLGHFPLP